MLRLRDHALGLMAFVSGFVWGLFTYETKGAN